MLRAGPFHRLGHGGHDALSAFGSRVYGPHAAAEVRGQLSRLSRPGHVRPLFPRVGPWPRDKPGSDARLDRHVVSQLAEQLVVVPYNRPDLLEWAFAAHGDELAAAICEPIYYNAGCILPTREFMEALRRLTHQHGALLLFDEVLSAFRMGVGGAQEYLGITPDLCSIGKSVGGGFPLSAFGGRQEIMSRLMPEGDCQHSGTYNGHSVAVAAGLAAVRQYRQPGFYTHIATLAGRLYPALQALLERHAIAGRVQGLGARFGIYFGPTREVRDYRDTLSHDRAKMLRFIAAAIDEGVYFHDYGGAACHHGFCAAMTLADVDEALARLDRALGRLVAQSHDAAGPKTS